VLPFGQAVIFKSLGGHRPPYAVRFTSPRRSHHPPKSIIRGFRKVAEEDGFELAVPPRRERLWAATPGKHCRFGPEPVSGSAFRAAVSDWQRPEEPFAGAGPMVRIRFPPAVSQQTFGSSQDDARCSIA
jgi:hypothetical protein